MLAVPTIHLNGTSKQYLFESICDAIDALHAAGDKLKLTAPNGRDYYPQGTEAIQVACDQHAARMQRLRDVIQELEEIATKID